MQQKISFEDFEHAVMQKILEKNTPLNKILREQYKEGRVINRDFTGVGFFTTFEVPKKAPRITESVERSYGNVTCSINGISDFGGFILFIEDGVIKCLEGYSFSDEWPKTITSYSLYSE